MKIRILGFLLMAFCAGVFAGSGNGTILTQSNCPLEITSFTAGYQPETSGSSLVPGHLDQIAFAVKMTNTTDKVVGVFRVGLVAFDAFDEFLAKYSGWCMEPVKAGKSKSGEWCFHSFDAFTFQRFGKAFVYVDAVRFEDGSIWRKNDEEVLDQLKKIEQGFTREKLQDTPPEK